jgi:nucleosome assembly protein 1-like 1
MSRAPKIIPRAVDYFTGKALAYEMMTDEEEDESDEEEEEVEVRPALMPRGL